MYQKSLSPFVAVDARAGPFCLPDLLSRRQAKSRKSGYQELSRGLLGAGGKPPFRVRISTNFLGFCCLGGAGGRDFPHRCGKGGCSGWRSWTSPPPALRLLASEAPEEAGDSLSPQGAPFAHLWKSFAYVGKLFASPLSYLKHGVNGDFANIACFAAPPRRPTCPVGGVRFLWRNWKQTRL